MLTRSIDQALDALDACRERVPFLRDLYREGRPERVVLDEVLNVVCKADAAISRRRVPVAPPSRPDGA